MREYIKVRSTKVLTKNAHNIPSIKLRTAKPIVVLMVTEAITPQVQKLIPPKGIQTDFYFIHKVKNLPF